MEKIEFPNVSDTMYSSCIAETPTLQKKTNRGVRGGRRGEVTRNSRRGLPRRLFLVTDVYFFFPLRPLRTLWLILPLAYRMLVQKITIRIGNLHQLVPF